MNSVFLLLTFRFCLAYAINEQNEPATEANDVVAVSDFFSVFLAWKIPALPPDGFAIECCKTNSLKGQRQCVRKLINETETRSNRSTPLEYSAIIDGLEMEMRYLIRVNPLPDDNKKHHRWINVVTKGYSARVVRCLDKFTEVEIDTGPYFGGRVGVEGATDTRCNLRGDPVSPRSRYLLLISHHLCGCQRISQFVVSIVAVHQFPSVITKSSHRFKVVCDLFPDPFTVQAELNLTSGAARRDTAETKADRLSERGYEDSLYRSREAIDFVPIIVVALLFVFVVLGVGMAFAWASLRAWRKCDDVEVITTSPSQTPNRRTQHE